MALLFMDGFDTCTAVARAAEKYVAGSIASFTTGRTGINAARNPSNLTTRTLTVSGGFIVGFAFRTSAFGVGDICRIQEGGTTHVALSLDASGHLLVISGASTLGTSTSTLSVNTWYYLEIKGTVHDTTGSFEVRVDGTLFGALSGTNVDTRQGATGIWDNVLIRQVTGNMDFDDYYVCDTSGATNNDFLGNCQIDTLLPQTDAVAAGSNASFTPSTGTDHGANVDETNPNGDTDYNSSSTPGQIDSYNYQSMGLSGTIRGVQVTPYLEKTDAGARTVSVMTRVAGTNYAHSATFTPATAYQYNYQIFETNPNSSAAWVVSDVNGAEFGLKIVT